MHASREWCDVAVTLFADLDWRGQKWVPGLDERGVTDTLRAWLSGTANSAVIGYATAYLPASVSRNLPCQSHAVRALGELCEYVMALRLWNRRSDEAHT